MRGRSERGSTGKIGRAFGNEEKAKMAEGPLVHHYARRLHGALAGEKTKVEFGIKKLRGRGAELDGATVSRVEALGKQFHIGRLPQHQAARKPAHRDSEIEFFRQDDRVTYVCPNCQR